MDKIYVSYDWFFYTIIVIPEMRPLIDRSAVLNGVFSVATSRDDSRFVSVGVARDVGELDGFGG